MGNFDRAGLQQQVEALKRDVKVVIDYPLMPAPGKVALQRTAALLEYLAAEVAELRRLVDATQTTQR
ncbi:MAG TPA: hypothetical protein VMH83_15045 [Candidatus Acidoferrum sp.]|nr:hypothetical protein [Candidatus Acidoferrum sp.]